MCSWFFGAVGFAEEDDDDDVIHIEGVVRGVKVCVYL